MKTRILMLVVTATVLCAGQVFAEEGHNHADHKGSMMEGHDMMEHGTEEGMNETEAVEVGNKICPVSKEKVGGDMGDPVKVEYNGKVYNLCCAMCKKDFLKNPEKYSAIAEDEVKNDQADDTEDAVQGEHSHDH